MKHRPMKQLLLMAFGLVAFAVGAYADDNEIVVKEKDGGTYCYSYSDLPTINISENGLSITCRRSNKTLEASGKKFLGKINFGVMASKADVNGDNKLDIADIIFLEAYPDDSRSDVNGDGKVTNKDVNTIIRAITQ